MISLGRIAHGVLSIRARLARLFRRAAPSRPPLRSDITEASHRRIEPRFADGPDLHADIEPEIDEEDDDEVADPVPRAARKPRAPKQPRRSSGGYALPALELLSAPSKVGRTTVSTEALQENATALEGVLGDFGVRGEIINARPGPGRHALRARARARHQIVARDRARRRYRALDERAVRARRGGVGTQRHRHRAAESDAREGLSARAAVLARLCRERVQAAALPRQDHRRRVGHRRPRPHAASADRRHHRLGQVGRHQHHDPEPAFIACIRTSAG